MSTERFAVECAVCDCFEDLCFGGLIRFVGIGFGRGWAVNDSNRNSDGIFFGHERTWVRLVCDELSDYELWDISRVPCFGPDGTGGHWESLPLPTPPLPFGLKEGSGFSYDGLIRALVHGCFGGGWQSLFHNMIVCWPAYLYDAGQRTEMGCLLSAVWIFREIAVRQGERICCEYFQ